ncbi:hypothetical protein BVG16_03920 [Paenibacillus selenitireducens]|uniref:DUF1405 domain-containing protein n=2 Tax=Paenibacillus selenitireducens TaxID=1324314 RepID=A0A1T2XPB9_9BACL|nr:hypothetical protein BVG16_03920 [Paenibacillus selenitireducens]
MNRSILWLLFISNLLGTLYGYYWYQDQLIETFNTHPLWQIIFVPDSPTASLFFTIAILFLLFPPRSKAWQVIRKVIEGLAVVTSVKYGIWAITMIVAGAALGDDLVWQHYMLMTSHLAMAVEALIYVPFFTCGLGALLIALGWTWLNDTVDYTYGIFPYLSNRLTAHLATVRNFTFTLTFVSFVMGWITMRMSHQTRNR